MIQYGTYKETDKPLGPERVNQGFASPEIYRPYRGTIREWLDKRLGIKR